MHSKLLSAHFCYFLRLYKCFVLLKKIVYTYAVPLAIIINLYFSKENIYDRCVVIKMSGVHQLDAVFLHCKEGGKTQIFTKFVMNDRLFLHAKYIWGLELN